MLPNKASSLGVMWNVAMSISALVPINRPFGATTRSLI